MSMEEKIIFFHTFQIIGTKKHNDFCGAVIFCHVNEITIYCTLRRISFLNKQRIKVAGIHSDPFF